jgi:hypothetical protein
MDGYN